MPYRPTGQADYQIVGVTTKSEEFNGEKICRLFVSRGCSNECRATGHLIIGAKALCLLSQPVSFQLAYVSERYEFVIDVDVNVDIKSFINSFPYLLCLFIFIRSRIATDVHLRTVAMWFREWIRHPWMRYVRILASQLPEVQMDGSKWKCLK